MISVFIICFCAFVASLLTLFTGFGLGTLLMPVIAIFFPVTVAIAITAIVHLLNNLFKSLLLFKHISWSICVRFGAPAVIAAVPGALLLAYLNKIAPLYQYQFLHITASVEVVKISAGLLLICFATMELFSSKIADVFKPRWFILGGLLSGFFGGLFGQQGAFRAPFLLHAGLTKEQYVATHSVIAVLIDVVRIFIYAITFRQLFVMQVNLWVMIMIVLSALLGILLGYLQLRQMTINIIRQLVAILLYCLGLLLISGILL